ncbi:MAG: hypothetical protein V2J42_09325 [Wenzhouxiangella sp.]|jgi:hypothetical protein|nr:hypothetical protein [Wenzhouxiangella sp.]
MTRRFIVLHRALARRFAPPGRAALLSLALLPATAIPQDYSLDFYTIDGGGEILAESADERWQLSGTLGQWDSTDSSALSGGGYTLTGGFWPVNTELIDLIFQDRFEVRESKRASIAESMDQERNQR